jgi:hypothetical protein
LSRAPSMPASIRSDSTSGVEEAGPIVATILVRRWEILTDGSLATLAGVCSLVDRNPGYFDATRGNALHPGKLAR